jgi:hypothetical protein
VLSGEEHQRRHCSDANKDDPKSASSDAAKVCLLAKVIQGQQLCLFGRGQGLPARAKAEEILPEPLSFSYYMVSQNFSFVQMSSNFRHLSKPFSCECYISEGKCNW